MPQEPRKTEVTADNVRIVQSTNEQENGTVIQLGVEATGGEPVAVRIANPVPHGIQNENVALHPSHKPFEYSYRDGVVLNEIWAEPETPTVIKFAIRTDDPAGRIHDPPVVLQTKPVTPEEFANRGSAESPFSLELADEKVSSEVSSGNSPSVFTHGDATNSTGSESSAPPDERDGPSFGPDVENIEPDTGIPTDGTARGGVASDDGSDGRGVDNSNSAVSSSETMEDPSEDNGSVVDEFIEELQQRDLTESEKETVLSSLDIEPPNHLEVKVEKLQSQMGELEAYREGLKAFIDEEGVARTIIDDINEDISTLQQEVTVLQQDIESLDEATTEDSAQIETLSDTTTSLEDRLKSLEQAVSSLETTHQTDIEQLQSEISQLEQLQQKLSKAFSG